MKEPRKRPDPRTWPGLIAWVGMCSWREWLQISAFVALLIVLARMAGWP